MRLASSMSSVNMAPTHTHARAHARAHAHTHMHTYTQTQTLIVMVMGGIQTIFSIDTIINEHIPDVFSEEFSFKTLNELCFCAAEG